MVNVWVVEARTKLSVFGAISVSMHVTLRTIDKDLGIGDPAKELGKFAIVTKY